MSRTVLAGLVGKSPGWVKQVEGGRLQMPKLHMVLRIAEALRVRELAELTGDQSELVSLFTRPGHARLPQVCAAIDTYPLATEREAPPHDHVKARLARAWKVRHASPHHREVIGALLPELIRDAQLLVRRADGRGAPGHPSAAVLVPAQGWYS